MSCKSSLSPKVALGTVQAPEPFSATSGIRDGLIIGPDVPRSQLAFFGHMGLMQGCVQASFLSENISAFAVYLQYSPPRPRPAE